MQQRNIIAFCSGRHIHDSRNSGKDGCCQDSFYLPAVSSHYICCQEENPHGTPQRKGQDKSIGWSPAQRENQDFQAFAVGINQVNHAQILVNSLSVIQYIGGAQAVVK